MVPILNAIHDAFSLQYLNNLSAEIHADNVAAGWWTDKDTGESLIGKRNIGELLCLVHSEVSEGYYGYDNDLMDDKLPTRKMFEVEMGDAVIRLNDILGSKGGTPKLYDFQRTLGYDYSMFICEVHLELSNAMEGFRKGKEDKGIEHVVRTILMITYFCSEEGLDLAGAIAEKRTFNKTREDHQLVNRLKEGGKAF